VSEGRQESARVQRRAHEDGLGLQRDAEAGRDLASVPLSFFGTPEDADVVKRNAELGIARTVVTLDSEKEDKILPILDRWSAIIHQVGA